MLGAAGVGGAGGEGVEEEEEEEVDVVVSQWRTADGRKGMPVTLARGTLLLLRHRRCRHDGVAFGLVSRAPPGGNIVFGLGMHVKNTIWFGRENRHGLTRRGKKRQNITEQCTRFALAGNWGRHRWPHVRGAAGPGETRLEV